MNWISLITGPLLPILTSIAKYFGDYFQKLSYIKQGRNEQKLDDLKEENKNANISKTISNSVDGLSDSKLREMFSTPKPNTPKK
jgi:hypothetical protein